MADSGATAIQADSGRYELAQIPNAGGAAVTPQTYTPFSPIRRTIRSVSLISSTCIVNGLPVISGTRGALSSTIIQNWMEDQWVAQLKKKYPVKIDEKAVAGLPK